MQMKLMRQLGREDGIALMMAMGMLLVLAIAGTSVFAYTNTNARSSYRSKTDTTSFSLAEAGLANALSVLNQPSNDPLDQRTLPSREATARALRNGGACWTRPRRPGRSPAWASTATRPALGAAPCDAHSKHRFQSSLSTRSQKRIPLGTGSIHAGPATRAT